MKKLMIGFLFAVGLVGCIGAEKKQDAVSKVIPAYFGEADGCFLLFNVKTNQFEKIIGDERCGKQFPACSTFKVPLAVMAFDAGLLKTTDDVLKWDGKKEMREEANKDHNAKTWMRDSIVWFSQRLTKKMGEKKFQSYLDRFDYGNKDVKGGLTQAWLVSPASEGPALKVSAYQQVDFMKKLWADQLPASKKSMATTREITFLETSPKGFQLSGKTGSNFYDKDRKMHLGWFIAHLQKGDQEYISVANFSDLQPTEAKGYGGMRAKDITKVILTDLGLW